jgi:hypothetical protein
MYSEEEIAKRATALRRRSMRKKKGQLKKSKA